MAKKQKLQEQQPKHRGSITFPPMFRTPYSEGYMGSPGEVNSGEVMTEPDLALSVRQLLVNHSRGILTTAKVQEGIFTDDIEIPVFTDITEIQEYREKLKQEEKRLSKIAKEEMDKAQDEKLKRRKEEQKRLYAELKKTFEPDPPPDPKKSITDDQKAP